MTDRPLRVVHLLSSLLQGGMEHLVVRLAREQRARGIDARIVAIKPGQLVARAEALAIPTHVLQRGGKADRILRTAAYFARARPDVVHTHSSTSLHYAILARAVGGGRIVLTDHNDYPWVPRLFEWWAPHAIVGVSEATAEASDARRAGRSVLVIRNGVEIASPARSREEVRRALGLGPGVVAIHVARLMPVKAQDVLLRAAALLRDRGVAVTVLVCGDGDERPRLEALARALGLGPDRLRFLGFRDDITDLDAAGDLFVMQSLTEGVPLAVLEAMAQGLPVVSTRVGGVAEVCLPGEHGLYVPAGDAEALAAAMERLATDAALRDRMGRAARAHVAGELSFDAMTRRYDALYARIRTEWIR